MEEHHHALQKTFRRDGSGAARIPRVWRELLNLGAGWNMPAMKRHAVYALVENVGEPLHEVVEEFYLKEYRDQTSTQAVSEGVLDLIGLHAANLGPEVVRKLIGKAIKRGLAAVRQAAYRIGAEQFGLDFVRPALKDDAGMVRKWAAKLLETKKLQPARKTTSKRRSDSTPGQ
jgi:hypothetical protein